MDTATVNFHVLSTLNRLKLIHKYKQKKVVFHYWNKWGSERDQSTYTYGTFALFGKIYYPISSHFFRYSQIRNCQDVVTQFWKLMQTWTTGKPNRSSQLNQGMVSFSNQILLRQVDTYTTIIKEECVVHLGKWLVDEFR